MGEWNLGLPVATTPQRPEAPPTRLPSCGVRGCTIDHEAAARGRAAQQEGETDDEHYSKVYCEGCEEWKSHRNISVVDDQTTDSTVRYCVKVTTDSDGDKRITRDGPSYNTDVGDSQVTETRVVCDDCGEELSVYDVDGQRV